MAIGAIPGEEKDGSKLPKCMLSWLRRVYYSFLGIPIYVCGSSVCVCCDPVVAFSLSIFPLFFLRKLPLYADHSMNSMFCEVLISVPHTSIRVRYVVREGYPSTLLTGYPDDFLHYSDYIHSGFRRRMSVTFSKIRPNLCLACISPKSLVCSLDSIRHSNHVFIIIWYSTNTSTLPFVPSTVTSRGAPFQFNSIDLGCSARILVYQPPGTPRHALHCL